MASLSLAARHRPQSFAEVVGQELVVTALSRAAATDRPAPAYLLSGTRGVGKTTIARIFAKALNCEKAPAPEPCNECPQCRKVTEGRHVDVCEIDGASNNRVEDARSLRETIGYAPMEGRYKVFIIDEAHMLSNSAFNALLKTLEEPPPRVVFIFATTEAHKFPITIVSRCQHFVFGHLTEEALENHLARALEKENRTFESGALKIIARRAAGSARDSLSLLDQALALGGELSEERVRKVLGLAGMEVYVRLFDALARADLAAVIGIAKIILQNGLDIGYFSRELAANLRNLFLLREGGDKMAAALHLAENEKNFLLEQAGAFSAAHLHAAWQLALHSQREIAQNPEPGAALEMLLLNIALLPRLLPVEEAAPPAGRNIQPAQAPARERPAAPPDAPAANEPAPDSGAAGPISQAKDAGAPASGSTVPGGAVSQNAQAETGGESRDWEGFRAFCASRRESGAQAPPASLLSALKGRFDGKKLILLPAQRSLYEEARRRFSSLQEAALAYFGQVEMEMAPPAARRPENEIRAELEKHPELQPCIEILNARILRCSETNEGEGDEKHE